MVRAPEILESSVFKLPVSKVSCGWKHTAVISGGDIYTWGWGGANGTFFEGGHSSGGQLVSYLLSLQLLVLHDDGAQHASSPTEYQSYFHTAFLPGTWKRRRLF